MEPENNKPIPILQRRLSKIFETTIYRKVNLDMELIAPKILNSAFNSYVHKALRISSNYELSESEIETIARIAGSLKKQKN